MGFGDGISWEAHVGQVVDGKTTKEVLHPYDANMQWVVKQIRDVLPKEYQEGRQPKFIDCGCHVGRWSDVFTQAGFDYTGVDQSELALEYARKNFPHLKWVYSFLWDMPFENEFDVAATIAVLQHNKLEEQERVVAAIRKALRVGGVFMMMESTTDADTTSQRTHEHWVEMVQRHGFKLVTTWHKNELGHNDAYLFTAI